MKRIYFTFVIIFLVFWGCSKEDVPTSPGRANNNFVGNADFTRYVAVGNSLTAGYQDGALFKEGQLYSYPNLIANQVKGLGINLDFQIPFIAEPGIGSRISITKITSSGAEVAINTVVSAPENLSLTRPYNNLGIPGSVVWIPNSNGLPISDVFQSVSFLTSSQRNNPFFAIVLRSEIFGKNLIAQVKAINPTFITVWLGNNDVLGYATSGGTSPSSPTPTTIFQQLYKMMIDSLSSIGAQMVVANIPDVTVIPYFTTVMPYIVSNGVKMYLWGQTQNGVRQLTDNDYVVFTAQNYLKLGVGLTQSNPLPNNLVLDRDEVAIAQQAVNSFNQIISSICSSTKLKDDKSIPVVDINKFLYDIKKNGYIIAGEKYTSDYIKGNLFSFDGVHPSSKGQALVANEFIKVINDRYKANIPFVDFTAIPGLKIPVSKSIKGVNNFYFQDNFEEKYQEILKLFKP